VQARARAQPFDALQRGLDVHAPDGFSAQDVDLAEAMRKLHIPSVDVALIDKGGLAWSHTFGTAPDNAIYQAASLSKLVTAVAALRLVDGGALDLDRNVNDELTGWRVPENDLTRDHPVTLRALLSMTAGIGVPGYLGYGPGQKLPTLQQILAGAPPANSPPVRVEAIPGSRYAYSGGGFEIVQALIEAATKMNFQDALQDLLLRPAEMPNSYFLQPLPGELVRRAAAGHDANGDELPGGWRVVPELAAGGLWSSATDLAHLLIALERAYRGEGWALLSQAAARAMMTQQRRPIRTRRRCRRRRRYPRADEARPEHRVPILHAAVSRNRTRYCGAERVGQWHDLGDSADPPRRRGLSVAAARAFARLTKHLRSAHRSSPRA
jgi:CubicO group peptidase (beta-lactamase class C family)